MAGLAAGLAATILAGLAGTYQGQQGTLTAWRIEIEPLGKWKEPRTELPRPRAPARLLCTLFIINHGIDRQNGFFAAVAGIGLVDISAALSNRLH